MSLMLLRYTNIDGQAKFGREHQTEYEQQA
jgi:hypothetical protein